MQCHWPCHAFQCLPQFLHVGITIGVKEMRVGKHIMLWLQISKNGCVCGKIHGKQVIAIHCFPLGGYGLVERRTVAKYQ